MSRRPDVRFIFTILLLLLLLVPHSNAFSFNFFDNLLKKNAPFGSSTPTSTPDGPVPAPPVEGKKEFSETTESNGSNILIYEVCTSPGCMADGAAATLERLQALAPPNVLVFPGGCNSLCGHGPVVTISSNEEKTTSTKTATAKKNTVTRIKRVSGQKIVELLHQQQKQQRQGPPEEIIKGYELVLQGDAVFAQRDYAQAVALYEQAVHTAYVSAMKYQQERELYQPFFSTTKTREPFGLEWLIRARRNEALAKLQLDRVEDAFFAAQAACNLSRNTCAESFRVLALTYERKKDVAGEYQALKTYFALPIQDEQALPFSKQNERRELTFRLAKLEKELQEQKKNRKYTR